jgi:beta-lactamase regulating signal transducer with metallopeptidase domain
MIRLFTDIPALFWWSAAALLGQGLLILLAFLIARRSLSATTADVRYRLALGTLFLLAASLPATMMVAQQSLTRTLAGTLAPAASSWPILDLSARVGSSASWLLTLWAIGACLALCRLAIGAWHLRRLIRTSRPAPLEVHPSPQTVAQAGLRVPPAVRESSHITGPFVAGWGRGVLMIPAGLANRLSRVERDAVLLHELVHLRRRDFALNLLQRLLQALLWFEPAIWVVGAELDRIREECCDAAVIRALGRPAVLARALVRLEELRAGSAALALAGTGGQLTDRIERLLRAAPVGDGSPAPAYFALGLLAATGMLAAHHGGTWAGSQAGRSVPVVTIAAEDPAGHFTLEMAGGVVRAMSVGGAPIPRDQLRQSGRTLHLLDARGRSELDIEIRSPGGISWTSRAAQSP